MPNIASVLKEEIARLARKEIRGEAEALKKASTHYRASIAELKREVASLQRTVKHLAKAAGKQQATGAEESETSERQVRFSAQRLAAHRAKLGLSAEAYGKLIGVTGQSIYKWEAGKARPRASQLEAIASVRKLGKREVAASIPNEKVGASKPAASRTSNRRKVA